jgi:hypothetical protein
MTIGELIYKINGDTSGIKKAVGESDTMMEKLTGTMKKVGLAVAAAFGIQSLKQFAEESVQAASAAAGVEKRFNSLFGVIKEQGQAAADSLAKNYGLTDDAAKTLLNTSGMMLQSMGVGTEKSLEFGTAVSQLAVDMASFAGNGKTAEEAAAALSRALAGQTRGLREFGIILGENTLKEAANAQGKQLEYMSATERAQLTLNEIYKAGSAVVGDFARNMYSYGNQSRINKMLTEEFSETIGKSLLPTATVMMRISNESRQAMIKWAEGIKEWIYSAEGIEKIGNIIGSIGGAFAALKSLLDPIIQAIGSSFLRIGGLLSQLSENFSGGGDSMRIFAGAAILVATAFQIVGDAIYLVINTAANFIKALVAAGQANIAFFKLIKEGAGGWDNFSASMGKSFDSIKTLGSDFYNDTQTLTNNIVTLRDSFERDTEEQGSKASKAQKKRYDELKQMYNDFFKAKEQAFNKNKDKPGQTQWGNLSDLERLKMRLEQVGMVMSGISAIMGAGIALINARTTAAIAGLDREMLAAERLAGVQEDTRLETAQKEYDAATGADKIAKKKVLDRVKIEEEYEKKKLKLQYKGAVAAWEMQKAMSYVQMVQAPLNAFTGTLAWASWVPGGYAIAVALASLAEVAAGLQFAAVLAAKPQNPGYATGGIIPGTSFSGDSVQANVNSGEMILNKSQQAQLFNIANGGIGGTVKQVVIDSVAALKWLADASRNGELFIHERSIVTR